MKSVKTPWTTGALLICTNCGKDISAETLKPLRENGEPSENLKRYLKSALKKSGHDKDIRVMTSSCLDMCDAGRQSVSYIPVGRLGKNENGNDNFTLNPAEDREELLQFLNIKIIENHK